MCCRQGVCHQFLQNIPMQQESKETGMSCQCVKSWWLNSLEWQCAFHPPPPIYCFPRLGKLRALEGTWGARVSMISSYCFPRGFNGFFFVVISVCGPLAMLDKVTHVYTCTYMHELNCYFEACNETAETRSMFCDKFMHALYTEFRCCQKPVISCSNNHSWIACVLLFTS